GGRTDATILADAFREICPLYQLQGGNRIVRAAGRPGQNRSVGCSCLDEIEADLASPSPTLSGTPHVQLAMHGWSATTFSSPTKVEVRHPDNPFERGYWTGGQTRQITSFWQILSHEICGHVAALVRTPSGM